MMMANTRVTSLLGPINHGKDQSLGVTFALAKVKKRATTPILTSGNRFQQSAIEPPNNFGKQRKRSFRVMMKRSCYFFLLLNYVSRPPMQQQQLSFLSVSLPLMAQCGIWPKHQKWSTRLIWVFLSHCKTILIAGSWHPTPLLCSMSSRKTLKNDLQPSLDGNDQQKRKMPLAAQKK